MRGAQYDFGGDNSRRKLGRRLGGALKFLLRLTVFLSALFFVVLYWPTDWVERLISFLEWLRYQ